MNIFLRKWRNMSAPAKASIAFVFSSFILKGINFLTTPIFTRLMDTSEYGILSTYNSWISIIDVFACLGLTSAGVINVGLNENKDTKKRKMYLSSMTGLCNTVTITVFLLILLIQKYLGSPIKISNTLLVVMFLHLLFNPAQVFWMTAERYEYKYKSAVLVTIFSALFGTITSLVAVRLHSENLGTVKIIYQEVGNALFYLPLFVYVLWSGKKYIDFPLWKKTLIFAIPLIPHYLSQHVMTSADRIMIADMISKSAAGIYAVVATINAIALMFWNAINSSLMPFTFDKLNNKDEKGMTTVINWIMAGYAVICFAVALVAPEVLHLLGPEEYQTGVYAVPPIVCVAFLTALYNLYSNVEFYYKKTSKIAKATMIAAIVNVLLNYLLIPRFGFIAAAYTTLISNVILVAMHYSVYRKVIQIKIYDDRVMLLILLLCVGSCLMCNALYVNQWIRYGIIIVILLVTIFERNKILNIFNKMRKKV